LLPDIAVYVQAVSVFGFGFKSKNNRKIIELILKILASKNGGRVTGTRSVRLICKANII